MLIARKLLAITPPLTFPIHLLLHHHHNIINPRKTFYTPTPTMSWECKKCTFLNPATPSQKPTCQICLSTSSPPQSPSSSSSSAPKWACKACTFLNPYKLSSCGVCDTRAPISSFEDLNDADDGNNGELENQVGSVFLPLQRCKRKRVEEENPVEVAKKMTASGWFFNLVSRLHWVWFVSCYYGKDVNVFVALYFFFSKDPVEIDKDSGTLNVFRGVKVTDKKITLSGSFWIFNLNF